MDAIATLAILTVPNLVPSCLSPLGPVTTLIPPTAKFELVNPKVLIPSRLILRTVGTVVGPSPLARQLLKVAAVIKLRQSEAKLRLVMLTLMTLLLVAMWRFTAPRTIPKIMHTELVAQVVMEVIFNARTFSTPNLLLHNNLLLAVKTLIKTAFKVLPMLRISKVLMGLLTPNPRLMNLMVRITVKLVTNLTVTVLKGEMIV